MSFSLNYIMVAIGMISLLFTFVSWLSHLLPGDSKKTLVILLIFAGAGAVTTAPSWLLNKAIFTEFAQSLQGTLISASLLAPVFEEILKRAFGLLIWRYVAKNSGALFWYGFALGLGFGLAENLINASLSLQGTDPLVFWDIFLLRMSSTLFLHAITTGLALSSLAGLGWAIALHSAWNLLSSLSVTNQSTAGLFWKILAWTLLAAALFNLLRLLFEKWSDTSDKKRLTTIGVLFLAITGLNIFAINHLKTSSLKKSELAKAASVFLNQPLDISFQNSSCQAFATGHHCSLEICNGPEDCRTLEISRYGTYWIPVTKTSGNTLNRYLAALESKNQLLIKYFLQSELRQYSSSDFATLLEAMGLTALGQSLKAIEKLETEIAKPQKRPANFHIELAKLKLEQGDFEAVDKQLRIGFQRLEGISNWTANPEVLREAAVPRFSKLARLFDRHELQLEIQMTRALAEARQNRFEESNRILKNSEGMANAPGFHRWQSQFWELQAQNHLNMGNLDQADEIYQNIVNDFENPNTEQKVWALYNQAWIATEQNRIADSIALFIQAVGLWPKNDGLRLQAIESLLERNSPGDYEIALSLAIQGAQSSTNEAFIALTSRLYNQLGLVDKSKAWQ